MANELENTFHMISEYLNDVEELNPISSHSQLFEEWEEEVREQFALLEPTTKDYQVLDALLNFRREVHECAVYQTEGVQDINSWEWLLTAEQSEQRTEEWLKEKVNFLTASEIGTVWAGPRTRAKLVLSKVPGSLESPSFTQRLAVRREDTRATDWGIRYEPVVKHILQSTLGITILDLGRIRHRSNPLLAASPDGLIIDAPVDSNLLGRLIEIKCPISRQIKEDVVPFEYWAQMQIQMEVCDRPACEYVEVKFEELSDERSSEAEGWIVLERCSESDTFAYQYHFTPCLDSATLSFRPGWELVELYAWKKVNLRRVTQTRDPAWIEKIKVDLEAFWKNVDAARQGTFDVPPPRKKKCLIVDDASVSPS
jgi:putative phage-type endonuclease